MDDGDLGELGRDEDGGESLMSDIGPDDVDIIGSDDDKSDGSSASDADDELVDDEFASQEGSDNDNESNGASDDD